MQAEELAKSGIIPSAYRRKPANILVAGLTGRAHGWDVFAAMRNGHGIGGRWRTGTVPAAEWGLIAMQAEELAKSDITPSAHRRKPANSLVAALTGRAHGWDVLTAMRNGHVIEGTWGMKPEAMLGLIRAAGHSVTGETGPDGAVVRGKRHDTGDVMEVAFTKADAERAGLLGKGTWKQYRQSMYYWRAVGLIGRMLFSDVTLGVYTTEELVAAEDIEATAAGGMAAAYEPVPLSEENIARFTEACETEGLDPERVLDEAFGEGVRPEPITDADLPAMRDAFRKLVDERASTPDGESPATVDSPSGTDDERPATRQQVGKIKGEYARLGIEDRLTQLAHSSELLAGVALSSHNDLTW